MSAFHLSYLANLWLVPLMVDYKSLPIENPPSSSRRIIKHILPGAIMRHKFSESLRTQSPIFLDVSHQHPMDNNCTHNIRKRFCFVYLFVEGKTFSLSQTPTRITCKTLCYHSSFIQYNLFSWNVDYYCHQSFQNLH